MITQILAKLFGTDNLRQIKKLQPIVDKINAFEPKISELTDEQLQEKTNHFREQLSQGLTLDDILPEAFAVVRETAKRKLGQRHFDVQLMGGIVLHQGKIAEMRTGEGKTLTATLPLYLNALSGKSAHLVTVNDYLARRDAQWMSPIYNSLGLEVGILQNNMSDSDRKKAYQADILYGTNNELGFDYLRDNMKFRLQDYMQRDLTFAIVDEVDSILIDEARTPLIISGSTDDRSNMYEVADRIIRRLKKDEDYEVDEKDRVSVLTESGNDKVEAAFNIDNLYAIEHINLVHHINQALRAHTLFKRDVDYVVQDNEVLIVDEFTGRILSGRRYSDGLHQALEAKEHVDVEEESQTLASITLQNYFRLYTKLAGMTGTAMTDAEEFYSVYKLGVTSIPTNRPMVRQDKADFIFLSREAKFKAIVEDITERYKKKQPVLIGTVAIETSELLSKFLSAHKIPHEVLNAKQHQREAEIVEHAGEPGHITIATNMAGRGTDIKLTEESKAAGGLYILGTERHESRRIDNQLRGRSGRQGDAGESRFYISLDDDLIRIFGGEGIKRKMIRIGMQEDEVIESNFLSKNIESSQEKVERLNFERRKNVLEYDDVRDQQRKVIYSYRRSILEAQEAMHELVCDLITSWAQDTMAALSPERSINQEKYNAVLDRVHKITGLPVTVLHNAGLGSANSEILEKDVINFLHKKYALSRQSDNATQETIKRVAHAEKWLLLETVDQAWKQHMLNLDHLKEGIGLRSWGQKNPLVEYKREAFLMFQDMMQSIRQEIVYHIFHLKIENFDEQALERRRERELEKLNMIGTSQTGEPTLQQPVQRDSDKVGRNDDCPCGSGKKYKKCCMKE